MSNDKAAVRKVLDAVKSSGETALTAPQAKLVCDAYNIPLPKEGLAGSPKEAAMLASDMGSPVVMKSSPPTSCIRRKRAA
jgi:acyl-CoA synthetase (NDP forming)